MIHNFNLCPENMDLNQFKVFIKRPAHGPKKTDKTGFHRSGPVFLSFRSKEDRSWSRSFNFGPKNRTGLDLQTLLVGIQWDYLTVLELWIKMDRRSVDLLTHLCDYCKSHNVCA